MVPLRFDPEAVPFPALTVTPAPTPSPSSILMFFFNFDMHPTVFKLLEQEKVYAFSLCTDLKSYPREELNFIKSKFKKHIESLEALSELSQTISLISISYLHILLIGQRLLPLKSNVKFDYQLIQSYINNYSLTLI